ncbi:MAG: TonB-dependent siderophore receptor [Cyanobacteria bacterium P01_C01_bin.89]
MKRLDWGLPLGLLPLIALTWAPPATAESTESLTSAIAEQQDSQAGSAVARLGVAADLEGTASGNLSSSGAIAQISSANTITAVDIEETEFGLSVNFTSNEPLTVETSEVVGNALVLTLPDATLDLIDPEQGEQFSPIDGIALVSVVGLAEGGVRVSITGNDAPPQVEVNTEGGNLVLGVTPGAASDVAADRDAIQIGVEGQTNNYYVPDSSTATRTNTLLDETPQSIQVIPQSVLEDQQAIQLGDALRNASGVVSSSRDQRGPRFIIRGFNSGAILRDGYRLLNAGTGNVGYQELANIERIEVLKGPASILSGALEPGGAINLVTEQPLPEPAYELSFRGGSRTLLEPSIDLTGPLTQDGRLLYRLNALYRREDFYRDFDTPTEQFFIAPTISWAINDRTDLVVEVEYSDETRASDFGGLPALGDRVADVPFDRITGEASDFATNESLQAGYRFEHRFSDSWKIRNSFQYRRFEPEFISNAAFQVIDEDAGDLFRVWIQNGQPISSYEVQTNIVGEFSTGSLKHTLLAGIDWYRQDFTSLGRADLANPQPPFNIFDPVYGAERPENFDDPLPRTDFSRTQNLGVYVQDQVEILDNLFLLAGLRFDTVRVRSFDFDNFTDAERDDQGWTPRVGIVYQPVDNLSLYGSYSTSFNPNAGRNRSGSIIEPERGRQFEVGARAELFDGRLTANLALFHITKTNVATADPEALPTDNFVVATGEQRSQGVELDVIGEILPGWNIVANYAYTDADITEDNTGIEGNRLFGVPEHNFNLWTSYEIQKGDFEGLSFGIGFNYVGDRFGDNDNSFVLEDYFLTSAAITYERDNWEMAINFRNLFDIDYIDSSEGSRAFENRPGEGFTVLGRFSIRF